MKCYRCNGTGYYDIDNECPVCDGTGEYEPFDADIELDKLYPTELTNEEWFANLTTEEKAKVLETIIIKYLLMKQPKCYEITKREFWELWLKQPHKESK